MVQREWDFVASESCIPVQVALQLMDTSTLGKAEREPEFLEIHDQIQRTLKSVVNGEWDLLGVGSDDDGSWTPFC